GLLGVEASRWAVASAAFGRGRHTSGRLRPRPRLEPRQPLRPVERVDERLGGHSAHTSLDMRYHGSHGEKPRGNDDTHTSRRLVARDDRPSHGFFYGCLALDDAFATGRSIRRQPARTALWRFAAASKAGNT